MLTHKTKTTDIGLRVVEVKDLWELYYIMNFETDESNTGKDKEQALSDAEEIFAKYLPDSDCPECNGC